MAKFTDKTGMDWAIVLDLGVMWDYKNATGVDIFSVAMTGRVPVMDLLGLAYFAASPKPTQRGYKSCADWLRGIGKDKGLPLADAVSKELEAFFPEPAEDAPSDPPNPAPGTGET